MSKKNNSEDVWKRIYKRGEDECWEWLGGKNRDGYGTMKIKNKLYLAHRLVYELTAGKIPEGMCVCHTCDNPSCCNPKHLWLGTHKDNMKDKNNKGRTVCGEETGSSKLTEKDVLEIREKYSTEKYFQRELGKEYGVSSQQICNIIHQKDWKI